MRTARQRAGRLAGKLIQARLAHGLSQAEMLKRLGVEDMIVYNIISDYERGERETLLPILLRSARAASVPTEVLIDDELNLPAGPAGPTDREGIRHRFASSSKKR